MLVENPLEFSVLSAILITLGAYALLAFTFLHPYVAMVMMAIAYSMCASALWPMVRNFIVKKIQNYHFGHLKNFFQRIYSKNHS